MASSFKLLMINMLLTLSWAVSSPEIASQDQRKGPPQQMFGPVPNSINTSQDNSSPFKPFNTIYSNSVYSQSLPPSGGPLLKPQSPPPYSQPPTLQAKYPGAYQSGSQPPTLQANYPGAYQSGPQPPTLQANYPGAYQSGPTPVIMQYLPQSQLNGGIQYLQLIPTRPLIVPISPYITQIPSAYHPSAVSNQASKAVLTASASEPIPSQAITSASAPPYSLYTPGSLIGGYASNAPTYRFFRPNGGMEIINPPQDLSFNTNEYLPSPSEPVMGLNRVARGRP